MKRLSTKEGDIITSDFLQAIGCKSLESILQIEDNDKLEKYIALLLKKTDTVFLITELAAEGDTVVPTLFSQLDKFGQRAIITNICEHIVQFVEAE